MNFVPVVEPVPVDPSPAPTETARARLRRLFLDGPGGYVGAAKRLGCTRQSLYDLVQGGVVGPGLVEAIELEYKVVVD